MAEADIQTGYLPSLINSPSMEVVYLEASTGETYTSQKFRKVTHIIATLNVASAGFTDEFISAYPSTTVNSQVIIKIAGTDTSDLPVSLLIFGEP